VDRAAALEDGRIVEMKGGYNDYRCNPQIQDHFSADLWLKQGSDELGCTA
jgi:hypothetical protein